MVDPKNQGTSGDAGSDSADGSARKSGADTTSRARQAAEGLRERASNSYGEASEWAEDAYETASGWAADRYDVEADRFNDMRQRAERSARRASGSVQEYVAENPMVVGLVGLAAGLLIGALLPRTQRENRAFGEWADELRHQGVRYAREATQKGRELVEETFEGEDPRFSKHDSDFRSPDGINRH